MEAWLDGLDRGCFFGSSGGFRGEVMYRRMAETSREHLRRQDVGSVRNAVGSVVSSPAANCRGFGEWSRRTSGERQ